MDNSYVANNLKLNLTNLENNPTEPLRENNSTELLRENKSDNFVEPFLRENTNRFVIFPLQYPDIYEFYKTAEALVWSDDEIDLSHDVNDWNTLSKSEQTFIKHILAFFAASDGIVMENLAKRFFDEIQVPEVRSFYSQQLFIENVHSIVYSKIILTIIGDINERNLLFNAVQTMPGVAKKANWALKWISSDEPFAVRLIAFAIVEGVFFSGSFSSIFWIRYTHPGKMPGTMQANELIMRDEGIHQDFAVHSHLFHIVNKPPYEKVKEMMMEAVDVEIQFMKDALPEKLRGMNIDLMTEHIKYVANRLTKQLGYQEIYPGVQQPFPFMNNMSIQRVANFFEPSRSTDYSKGNKYENYDNGVLELNSDDEF